MSDKTLMFKQPYIEIIWPDGITETLKLTKTVTKIGGVHGDLTIPPQFSLDPLTQFEVHKKEFEYTLIVNTPSDNILLNEKVASQGTLQNDDVISLITNDAVENIIFNFKNPLQALAAINQSKNDDDSTLILGTNEIPINGDYLEIQFQGQNKVYYPLTKDKVIVGRGENNDLSIPEKYQFVSRKHFELTSRENDYIFKELGSANGTRINGQLITPNIVWPLRPGDKVRVGDENIGSSIGFRFLTTKETNLPSGFVASQNSLEIPENQTMKYSIGRIKDNYFQLDTPKVSRYHAEISIDNGVCTLKDLNSLNGTKLNGENISSASLTEGDLIEIGDNLFSFENGKFHQFDSQGMRVDVINLSKSIKTRQGKLDILHDIDMSVLPGEFIAIVGGSGAGKTTLINALLGINPGKGEVLINGHDFYQEYENFRDQIGYVPQSNILHTSLTVEKALAYSLELRLPTRLSNAEQEQRITAVLKTVNLNTATIRQTRIRNLSGGQRKRVSIAAELLADPKLLYLDEPTSGLDPGMEKKMMYTLRQMADQGRTVILITHATANIVQVDNVAFISEGRLVFYGSSNEALDFFGVTEFADIYEQIDNRGKEWWEKFTIKENNYFGKNVLEKQKNRFFQPIKKGMQKTKYGLKKFFNQLFVLTRRTFSIQSSDLITLGMLAALYPFTAILQLLISSPEVFTGDINILADPILAAKTILESYTPLIDTRLFVFISGLEAVLIGMYVPSNEFILERNIYIRERMVNLKIPPYLTSKIIMFSIFSFIQCVLYLWVLRIGVDYPTQGVYFPAVVEIFITVFITMVSSIGIGLFVSSISRTPDMAMYILVILLFFQFFFAGVIFDLRGKNIQPLQNITSTHWSMIALGSTINMNEMAESTIICTTIDDNPATVLENDPLTDCSHYPEAIDDLQITYGDDELVKAWVWLSAIGIFFFALTGISIKRLDKI